MAKFRLGVDIGGTFTDAMLVNMETSETRISKVPTTPTDLSAGFLLAVQRVLEGIAGTNVDQIVHATTVATNSVIQGKVAKSGLVTTKGFRDVLEIQRQIKPKLYDLFFEKPKPLIPRYLCFEVTERLDAEGKIVIPLDEDEVRQVAMKLKQERVDSVAVSLLHSYQNPKHERAVKSILSEELPEAYLTLSSEICPVIREYPRACTTAINAVLMPIVSTYIDRLEKEINYRGFDAGLYIMQSSGGIMTSEVAKERPAYMVESGPAAGVIAASVIGKVLGYRQIISFDMGGTTAKAGLVEKGEPKTAANYEVGVAATPGTGMVRGSGYPLMTPVIDLVEIGAGGGSVAWIDSGGSLRVGPQSAGADPGPACYETGGVAPTVTDANLVLGRIDPEYFLGGEMKVSVEAARKAIARSCGSILNGDIVKTAHAIIEIANANMLRALRLISVERGYDPREFVMVAFGGAGPMHVNRLAQELKVPSVIIPINPGLTSAMGLLMTDFRHTYVTTLMRQLDSIDLYRLNKIYHELESNALKLMLGERVLPEDASFLRYFDMRYVGQSYELEVSVPNGTLTNADLQNLEDGFHKEHERSYGHYTQNEPIEVVNIKLVAVGLIPKAKLREVKKGSSSQLGAIRKRTQVFFQEVDGFTESNVYDRYRLEGGNLINGPAIIADKDATTILHPEFQAEVDRYGNLLLTNK